MTVMILTGAMAELTFCAINWEEQQLANNKRGFCPRLIIKINMKRGIEYGMNMELRCIRL